jgi:hypothetical protein
VHEHREPSAFQLGLPILRGSKNGVAAPNRPVRLHWALPVLPHWLPCVSTLDSTHFNQLGLGSEEYKWVQLYKKSCKYLTTLILKRKTN